MLHLLKEGGPLVLTYMLPLLCYSILSLAVMLERTYTLGRLRRLENEEFSRLKEKLAKGGGQDILTRKDAGAAPIVMVVRAGLEQNVYGLEHVKEAIVSALAQQSALFSRYLGVLATVGSTAPFIGLFGTVLGILRAFNKIAQQGFSGPSVVAGGIAEALMATAFGLGVAIPAVIAYNIFVGKVSDLTLVVSGHASQLLPLVAERETVDAGT